MDTSYRRRATDANGLQKTAATILSHIDSLFFCPDCRCYVECTEHPAEKMVQCQPKGHGTPWLRHCPACMGEMADAALQKKNRELYDRIQRRALK